MNPQTIKKNRTGIIHLPKFLPKKRVYRQRIAISTSMCQVSDSCDSGWNKLWGVAFGHQHWHSSYRFVFRNDAKGFRIGYYAYINGVSPQTNQTQKGYFTFNPKVILSPRTILTMYIVEEYNKIAMYVEFDANDDLVFAPSNTIKLPTPNFRFPITESYPNLKCKQKSFDTTFQFLKP